MDKKKFKFSDSLFATILLYLAINILSLPLFALYGFLASPFLNSDNPAYATTAMYTQYIVYWIATIAFLLIVKQDRPILHKLLPGEGGNTLTFLVWGMVFGFITNTICIICALLHGDIYLYFSGGNVLLFIFSFIAVVIQSGSEELMMRVFFYQRVSRRYGPIVAIIASSILFALMHIFNDYISVQALIDLFLSGVVFALMIYYFDSFFMSVMAHTLWNYTQNIIFGLPNSGYVSSFSIFKLDASTAMDSLFYNVGFGVEGSIMAIIVELASAALLIVIGERKLKREKICVN